jgi:hypothetical protein
MAWWLSWWVVLFWLWLAFAGEWNWIEWAAAAIAASAGATIAAVVRAQRELRFSFRRAWLREAAGVPRAIVVDCVVVLAELRKGSRFEGAFQSRPTGPVGDSAEAAGRAAFLAIAACYSPNAYVVDVDRSSGDVLTHALVPRRDSERPA